ncbi:hypothetical protein N0V90_001109 [Kalmusia sp. IMI 367209]|nr:hypothetical protein N0V90_001109 [Kalmusia sp. IMI 367209]
MSHQFNLTRASVDDIPEITRLEYRCFPPLVRELFMGCKTEADIPHMSTKHSHDHVADPFDVWVKVVDNSTGNIVAASNWKFFVNSGAPSASDETPPEWLKEDARQQAAAIMRTMNDGRRKANPGPHVHPDYQRRGLGSMIMEWGCNLADQLFLPVWIEASSIGGLLYRKFGFYDIGPMGGGIPGMCMRRDARGGPQLISG